MSNHEKLLVRDDLYESMAELVVEALNLAGDMALPLEEAAQVILVCCARTAADIVVVAKEKSAINLADFMRDQFTLCLKDDVPVISITNVGSSVLQ